MDINSVSSINAYQNTQKTESAGRTLMETSAGKLVEGSPAAVYEQSDLITTLQNDAEARANQLKNMVSDALKTQAGLSVGGDDVWKFLASGNFTVSAAAKEEAQKLIAEDGYYGVEQTSERIVQFAKALSGGDTSKAESLLKAFKKGYDEATKAWGKELPEISKKTYEAVEKKFDEWVNGSSATATE